MDNYQLVEIEVIGKYKDNAVFRLAAIELWKKYKEADWNVDRMLKKKPTEKDGEKKTIVVFEITRKEEANEQE